MPFPYEITTKEVAEKALERLKAQGELESWYKRVKSEEKPEKSDFLTETQDIMITIVEQRGDLK